VPESPIDQELEQLLGYHDEPHSSEFVANLMHAVQREQRIRRVILWAFGLVGALFGLLGATLLSGSITRLFTFSFTLPATETMQVALAIVAIAAIYTWFMNDDLSLGN
jgi:uncharacterized membrane protein YsdA (DUF1294 family)